MDPSPGPPIPARAGGGARTGAPSSTGRVVGGLLVLPALLLMLGQLLIPSVQTIWLAVVGSSDPEFMGGVRRDDTWRLVARALPSSLGSGITMVLVPWLGSAVLGAGLAQAARGPRAVAVAGRVVTGVVVGAVALAAAVSTFVPYLAAQGETLPPSVQGQVTTGLLRMWGLSLPTALVQLVVAAAAAIGIGWLRLFGPNSRRLLLIFAPWLLVAPVTLSLARFDTLRTLGLIDTPFALLPATLVSVPALVLLTLLADGLRGQRDAGMPLRAATGPCLGIAALLVGALWVGAANDVAWPMVLSIDPDSYSGNLLILRMLSSAPRVVPYSAALPIVLLVVMLAASAVLHATSLGRVRLTSR